MLLLAERKVPSYLYSEFARFVLSTQQFPLGCLTGLRGELEVSWAAEFQNLLYFGDLWIHQVCSDAENLHDVD